MVPGGRSASNSEGNRHPFSFYLFILFYFHHLFLFGEDPKLTVMNFAFCRIVLTALLGMKDRLDWKACAQSDEDDTLDANQFKTAFAPFDDSLE